MKLPTDFPKLDDLLEQMGVPFQPFVAPEIERLIFLRVIKEAVIIKRSQV